MAPTPTFPARALRVVIVEDHRLYRQGMRGLLEDHGHEVVGEAPTANEGLRVTRETRPDVVILDVNLPGASGLDVIQAMREEVPGAAVLMMTMSAAREDLMQALVSGASGYVLKDASVEEMLSALDAVARGDAAISPVMTARVVEHLRAQGDAGATPKTFELSERESAVLRLLVDGRDNRQIAAALHLGLGTVKADVSQILDKLGVDNRVAAAVTAVRHRLV